MQNKNVDPAALLVAVFTVGIGPLTEAGAWELINTIVASLVALILICFVIGRREAESGRLWRERLAVSLTLGFIGGVALAWPTQEWLLAPRSEVCRRPDVESEDACADDATLIALGSALVLALAVWLVAWGSAVRRGRRDKKSQEASAEQAGFVALTINAAFALAALVGILGLAVRQNGKARNTAPSAAQRGHAPPAGGARPLI